MKIGVCEEESSRAGSAEAEGYIPSAQIPITFKLGISVRRIRRNGGNRRSRAVLVSFDGAGNQHLVASMFGALGSNTPSKVKALRRRGELPEPDGTVEITKLRDGIAPSMSKTGLNRLPTRSSMVELLKSSHFKWAKNGKQVR